jgi:hypothetical protein
MNNTPAKDRTARPGRRGRASSRPMIITISTILLLGVTSSVAAQKHRKYSLPNFHTGQGGLVNLPEPRHRADKFLGRGLELMPISIEFVIPQQVIRLICEQHRRGGHR